MAETFHVYIGSETGLFKAVNLSKKSWCNVNKPSQSDRKTVLKELQINTLSWREQDEEQVCLGLINQTVCIYDVARKDFVQTYCFQSGVEDDELVGLEPFAQDFIVCTKSGSVNIWSCDPEPQCKAEINAGQNLSKMRQNKSEPHLIATGGQKNDLKIWDLNNSEEPVFRAKNVRHDFLNLEVPVWVSDMAFLPDSKRVVTCSNYHQIRVYDPSQQRRPVTDIEWDEYPLKALSLHPNGYHVFVGNSRGDMAMVDLRGKSHIVQKYKGGAGSIRSLECHASQGVVASCGLDRYLRLHDINSNKLLQKFYLKSKLNCLLFSSKPFTQFSDENQAVPGDDVQVLEKDCGAEGDEAGDEQLWQQMETIKKKKRKGNKSKGSGAAKALKI